jgi:hypothetical protein
MEKLLIVPGVAIAPRLPGRSPMPGAALGLFDALGRRPAIAAPSRAYLLRR